METFYKMDMESFINSLFPNDEKISYYSEHEVWDIVWRKLLSTILREEEIPQGSIIDMIPIVGKFVKTTESLSSTIKCKCSRYLSTNRKLEPVYSELWCDVILTNGRRLCLHKDSLGHHSHAEIQVIQYLEHLKDGEKPRNVKIYSNTSPCSRCADVIERFAIENPDVNLRLYFTSIFGLHGENHRQGLRNLDECGIQLAVFDDDHWRELADCVEFLDAQIKKRRLSDDSTEEQILKKQSIDKA